MLARRLPSILPAMSSAEALEVTKIYSVAGLLDDDAGIVAARPFRAPHHTISQIALCGGGSSPRPGEISLAQHGVLFLEAVPISGGDGNERGVAPR
jgi:magnesium chelatase family protein